MKYFDRLLLLLVVLLWQQASIAQAPCNSTTNDYRTIDGSCNNQIHPEFGRTGSPMIRLAPANYADDICTIIDGPNARAVSNLLFRKPNSNSIPDQRGLSSMIFSFLQFFNHDLDLFPTGGASQPIVIPENDPVFGAGELPFSRALTHPSTPAGKPCTQISALTGWIDASTVYGSEAGLADWLRTHVDGKLKVSPSPNGDLLPCNTIDGDCFTDTFDPFFVNPRARAFVAGDSRANEQPGLLALHTLFLREHNRLCDQYLAEGMTNDEAIYQRARRQVGAQVQAIVYNEMIPALGIRIPAYQGYQSNVDPSITSEFGVAAFRFGHTMVTNHIPLVDENCEPILAVIPNSGGVGDPFMARGKTYDGAIPTSEAFLNSPLVEAIGIEPILLGLSSQNQEKIDRFVVEDLRSALFGNAPFGPLDLAAINLQRGRDHGLAYYNDVRHVLGLEENLTYDAISKDPATKAALAAAYPDIDKMDVWAGMLAEDHLPNAAVGPTIAAVLVDQFTRLRNADRFWYQNDPSLTSAEKNSLDNLQLSDIIKRNTTISKLNQVAYADCEQYCRPTYRSVNCLTHISGVEVNNYSNYPTDASKESGYYKQYDEVINLTKGQSTQLQVYINTCYSGNFSTDVAVWIDYNQNAVFETNEQVYSLNDFALVNCAETLASLPFTVSTSSKTGLTRMRIRTNMADNSTSIDPCMTYDIGETEDYLVNITSSFQRIAQTTQEEEEEEVGDEISLEVNPNPLTENSTIYLHLPEKTTVQLTLFNAVGQKVWGKEAGMDEGGHQIPLGIEGLPPGNYFLYMNTNGEGIHRKLVLI